MPLVLKVFDPSVPPMAHRFILDQASASDMSDTASADEMELLAPPAEVRAAARFRVNAKKFLLTYARCPEDPEHIFSVLDSRRKIARAVGCIELHQDGDPHVHIALEYEVKYSTTNSRAWDYEYDVGYDVYHPNVSVAKSWPKCLNYCRGKDKETVALFQWRCTFQEALDQHVVDGAARVKPNLAAVARSLTREAWLQYCYEQGVNFGYCEGVWKHINAAADVSTIRSVEPAPGPPPPGLDASLAFRELPAVLGRSIVVCGPSGSGKTTWATAQLLARYGTFLMVNNIDTLRTLRPEIHRAILFDEIRFNGDLRTGKGRRPLEGQIAACDLERGRTIRCRYSDAAVPAGMPRIFTCTDYLPFSRDVTGQIARRIVIINLYQDRDTDDLWPPEPSY